MADGQPRPLPLPNTVTPSAKQEVVVPVQQVIEGTLLGVQLRFEVGHEVVQEHSVFGDEATVVALEDLELVAREGRDFGETLAATLEVDEPLQRRLRGLVECAPSQVVVARVLVEQGTDRGSNPDVTAGARMRHPPIAAFEHGDDTLPVEARECLVADVEGAGDREQPDWRYVFQSGPGQQRQSAPTHPPPAPPHRTRAQRR